MSTAGLASTRADTLTEGLAWGYKQGCDFATAQCTTDGVVTATGAEGGWGGRGCTR